MKYSEILKKNRSLEKIISEDQYNISILSNIMTSQLNEILELTLREESIPALAESGNYNNILQDSQKYKESNSIIIFWELCNIIEDGFYNLDLLSDHELEGIINRVKSEIDFVLKNLNKTSLVFINTFSSLFFPYSKLECSHLDIIASNLNQYLKSKVTSNVKLIDIERVIASVSIKNSFNVRYFYSSETLYTIDFYKEYSKVIKPIFMSAYGLTKKALIFDCDNTLWKGVLGEDGFNNIEMSTRTKKGSIFAEIQSIAIGISKKGVLIGLCSKNNLSDIKEVFKSHPDIKLKNKYITINKSNWLDKASNLKRIADELNIGLDSLVFIDDSSFEVNLIREQLPEVTVLQVPQNLFLYPQLLRENLDLFYSNSTTNEDIKKTEMYKEEGKRSQAKENFRSIKDYLLSLSLKLTIYENNELLIPRLSQMSQKTNQFNLTTKRYTENNVKSFIEDTNTIVYSISVTDKYGDSGITGLCILKRGNEIGTFFIDTFLMSCRIIGRDIEFAFIYNIINRLKKKKVKILKASYYKTKKNDQVKSFFEKCSFSLLSNNKEEKTYSLNIPDFSCKEIKYIEVINGE